MKVYTFHGIVVPERADITIINATRALENAAGETVGSFFLKIKHSKVKITAEINIDIDIGTLKNVIYNQARVFVNSSALFLGVGCDIDIHMCIDHDKKTEELLFAPRALPISNYINNN